MLNNFDFKKFIETSELSDVKEMVIRQPSYFEEFGELFNEVDLQAWKDYLSFRLVNEYASALSEDISKRRFDFTAQHYVVHQSRNLAGNARLMQPTAY